MALPYTFATQPTGNVPASYLDSNFAAVQIQGTQAIVATGVANTYVATPADALSPSYAAYRNRGFYVSFPANNTGPSTINFSGLGAANIYKISGGSATTSLAANDIIANAPYLLVCNGTDFVITVSSSSVLPQNRLDNVSGAVYQLDVAATTDNAFFADRWLMLTQTASVTPSVLSAPETGYASGIRVTQTQVAAQRFGFQQTVESVNCLDLRSQTVSFSPRVRISNSQAIRYAILAWTGTADTMGASRDTVLDWTSSSYTAGGFFIASNLTVVAVGSSTPSANTWTTLPAISGTCPAGMNNLLVFVWTEGTAAQNVTLDFDYMACNAGGTPYFYEPRPYQQELDICSRYHPVVPWNTATNAGGIYLGQAFSATQALVQIPLDVPSRIPITGVTVTGTSNMNLTNSSGGFITPSSIVFNFSRIKSVALVVIVGAGLTAGNATSLGVANTGTNQKFVFTGAEL